ncbi:GIY-YIG nuclease family protein [Bradyrhizobium sp. 83002]|uniref:GIY-YIG nuclease family protein n=1 Tax=Bradyrhizobium aeschynomenes TaxID=2734909 RepID=UPI001551D1E1|nr:GIY-YIG nuclease family protein [Bradyrhizobium aeschynomenes]NPU13211.1 GIY-YIG nuclease family protein [Bradyrhizobium aeschynomenes]
MGTRSYYVYILASHIGGTLYIGVTNDPVRRVAEHRSNLSDSFTKRYGVTRLVYFEVFEQIEQAIHREKRLKKWQRDWKISLIEKDSPDWNDLYPQIAGGDG